MLREAEANEATKRTNLLKAMADHQTAIMALPLSKVSTALNDLHPQLQQTVNTELESLSEDVAIPIRAALAEIIRLERIYVKMNEAERIRPAIQYLWDNMTWPDRLAATNTTTPPTVVLDSIGGNNDQPALTPIFMQKNLAIELIEKRIPHLSKKPTTASPRAEGTTVCEHIVSNGLEFATLISNNARDIADVAAAAGWEKFNITRIPTDNPKLILDTIAAMIMRGIHVTVDPMITRRLEDQLNFLQKGQYRTLLALSNSIKQAKDVANNSIFDDKARALFTKVFLAANDHKDRKKMHGELLQLLANSEEGLIGLTSIIDDLKNQNVKDIKDIKKYILDLLPSDKRKDLDAHLNADETKDAETAIDAFIKADANAVQRAQELYNLLKKPESNYNTMYNMLSPLTASQRLNILKELHKLYIDNATVAEMSKTTFGKKTVASPPQALINILPDLIRDATTQDIMRMQEDIRIEANIKLIRAADPAPTTAEIEASFTKYLFENNFVEKYAFVGDQANRLADAEFISRIQAAGVDRTSFIGDNATTATLDLALNDASLVGDFAINKIALIKHFTGLYRENPCEMALSYLKLRTKPIIEKLTDDEKKQLIRQLEFPEAEPTAIDETILATLMANGIKNASSSKLFAAASIDTPDLANEFVTRINYLIIKGDSKNSKIEKLIADDLRELSSVENHDDQKLMNALIAANSQIPKCSCRS